MRETYQLALNEQEKKLQWSCTPLQHQKPSTSSHTLPRSHLSACTAESIWAADDRQRGCKRVCTPRENISVAGKDGSLGEKSGPHLAIVKAGMRRAHIARASFKPSSGQPTMHAKLVNVRHSHCRSMPWRMNGDSERQHQRRGEKGR